VIWILTGLVGVLIMGLWFSIKTWIKRINIRMDEIMNQLNIISKQNVGFEKDIMRMDNTLNSHDKRMHDYSDRIRELEYKQASCQNCKFR
jgi:chromosome segregation ATPase